MGDTPVDHQEENVANGAVNVDYRGNRFRGSVDFSDESRSMLGYRDAIELDTGVTVVPRAPKASTNLFDHSSTYDHHQMTVLSQGSYDLSQAFSLYGSYGYAHQLESYAGPGVTYLEDNAGAALATDLTDTSDTHTNVGRMGMRGNVKTGKVQNNFTLAADYLQIWAGYFYEYGDSYDTNLYNPVALAPLASRTAGLKNLPNTNLNRLSSVVVADVLTALDGKLTVIGGVRGEWIGERSIGTLNRGSNNTPVFDYSSATVYNKGMPSPSIAAMYHLPKGFSVYANYMQDLQQGPTAPTTASNPGQVFAPYVAKQQEAGAKYEHGTLLATLAVYQISEPNGTLNTQNTFVVNGEQRNRGLEFELSGNVAAGVRLNGGITFMDARQENTGEAGVDGLRAQGIPGTQATVNAEWTVPKVKSLNLDARVTASGGQWADTVETMHIPAWARLDIGGRYELKTKMPVTFRVNIDNVTGNNYYESSYLGLNIAAPRTLRLSSGIRF